MIVVSFQDTAWVRGLALGVASRVQSRDEPTAIRSLEKPGKMAAG
jgi:hypothetical protein